MAIRYHWSPVTNPSTAATCHVNETERYGMVGFDDGNALAIILNQNEHGQLFLNTKMDFVFR